MTSYYLISSRHKNKIERENELQEHFLSSNREYFWNYLLSFFEVNIQFLFRFLFSSLIVIINFKTQIIVFVRFFLFPHLSIFSLLTVSSSLSKVLAELFTLFCFLSIFYNFLSSCNNLYSLFLLVLRTVHFTSFS
jgi:hypothetical protein